MRMKKLFTLLLVIMGMVCTLNVHGTSITFYYAITSSDVGSYSVYLNQNTGTGWGHHGYMSKTDKTYMNHYIYEYTWDDTAEKIYDIQFQLHNGESFVSQQNPLDNTEQNISDYNGKLYVHNKGWTDYKTDGSTIIYHVKATGGWTPSKAYAYTYFSENNVFENGSWGGADTERSSINSDWYDYKVTSPYTTIIFNDGANPGVTGTNKTESITIGNGTEYWVTNGASSTNASGVTSTLPADDYKYTRTVTAGNYGTICLPYNATISGADVYTIVYVHGEFDNLTGISIEPINDHKIMARDSYIFKATSGTLTATLEGSYSEEAKESNAMMGNLSKDDVILDGSELRYVIKDNTVRKVVKPDADHLANVTVGQYRAYITLDNFSNPSAPALNSEFIPFFDEAPSGINTVQISESKINGYYNLNGQRVAQPTKGLYIVNGKKVVLK